MVKMSTNLTIGQQLMTAREKSGLSLKDFANQHSLPLKRLVNFEKDKVDYMAIDVYDMYCLKSYCHKLGLIYDDLVKVTKMKPIRLNLYQHQAEQDLSTNPESLKYIGLFLGAITIVTLIYSFLPSSKPVTAPQEIQSINTMDQFELYD